MRYVAALKGLTVTTVLALWFNGGCKKDAAGEQAQEPPKQKHVKSEAEQKAEAEFRKQEEAARATAAESASVNALDEEAVDVEKAAGKRVACKSLWFLCEDDGDDAAMRVRNCEKNAGKWNVESDDRTEHARLGQKTSYWTRSKCQDLTAQFDKADKARASAIRSHYTNHCEGDGAEEGVRAVAYNDVEYEVVSFRQSGRSVSATIVMRHKGSSPADYVGINGSELTTVEDTTYNPLEPGGCIIGTLNPGEKKSCGISWQVKAGEKAKSIDIKALSGKSLCVLDFKSL